MPARTLDDFKRFMAKHTGPTARFLDPQFPHSAEVRLYHCGAADIARYLLNYMGRDRRYTEKARLPLPLLLPPRLLSLSAQCPREGGKGASGLWSLPRQALRNAFFTSRELE